MQTKDLKIKSTNTIRNQEEIAKSTTRTSSSTSIATEPPTKPPRLKVQPTIAATTTKTAKIENAIQQYEELEGEEEKQQPQSKPKKHLHFQSPLEVRHQLASSIPAECRIDRYGRGGKYQMQENNTKYAATLLSATTDDKQKCNNRNEVYEKRTTRRSTASTKSATQTSAMKSTSASFQENAASNEPNNLTKGDSDAAAPAPAETFAVTFPAAAFQQAKNRLAYGCSSLMYACQSGDIVTVLEQLRSKPERIRQRDSHNKNALHYCAAQSAGKRDLVAAASIAIAAPELLGSADEDGFTPLHLAVIQGNLAMVNLLLANKADVNAVDNEGHSVVHWATVCGEVEALRCVLSAGANVAIPDINGGSPMHYAAQMCGANYECKLGQGNSTKLALEILSILLAHPQASVDIQDKDGRQPLLWAASAGSAKAIIALVKAGARVESADKDGLTALHCSASRGHTECIDTLISLCGAPTDLIDSNGCTALHYAVTLGHADATSRLLDLDADPNRQDRKGRTPAHCGCSKGQFETVKLLKERGANLWLRNAKGDLPVHEAASSGRRELVAWLLEQKPKQVNTTSNDGRSLLHIAASNDYTDMCKMLLDFGGDINAIYRNSKGVVNTPLDCALQRGNRSTAKFLQSNGGLPAGKLRLAARRANPFQEATGDAVRPLKYVEKEEIHDLRNSKKYVIYLKRSDSDGGEGGAGESSCSCTEQTYKREQRYAHKCRKHRRSGLRRRTSSCGESKEVDTAGKNSEICRSKSNIELSRRRRRERNASSSECDSNEEDDEDSCENCCYHKRQKQRVLQRRRTVSLRKSKDILDSEDEVGAMQLSSEKENSPHKQKQIKEPETAKEKPVEAQNITGDKVMSLSSMQNRPQSTSSSRKRQQQQVSGTVKEATFIKSPPTKTENAKEKADDIKKTEDTVSTHTVEFTDEDDQTGNKTAKTYVTQVDVHCSAEDATRHEETTKDILIEKDIQQLEQVSKDALTKQASKEIEQLLQIAATAVEYKNGEQKDKTKVEIGDEEAKQQETATPAVDDVCNVDEAADTTKSNQSPIETNEKIDSTQARPESNSQSSAKVKTVPSNAVANSNTSNKPHTASSITSDDAIQKQHKPESRRSFTLLPTDSAEDEAEEDQAIRKSSFQILKSDESMGELEVEEQPDAVSDTQVFKIIPDNKQSNVDYEDEDYEEEENDEGDGAHINYRHGVGSVEITTASTAGVLGVYDSTNGRKRRLKRRIKSGGSKTRTNWKGTRDARQGQSLQQQSTKDQDSGFEPSPRATKTRIPAPRNVYTAYTPRRSLYTTLVSRSCSGRQENRKPGDKNACDMTAVTRSIQRNIRRYYMERKIFQHLLELKSLQIRSNKLNEAVLVKRAVDDYHRSCASLGGETGTRLRRYTFTEYSFKNFELFLYETLKSLQRPGTYNFQNINEVYEEAERRLSPDYNAYEKALHCTTKTHRCPHAIHAYTGIPCAAYIPMMNHHTMPKFGFGPYKKTNVGSFYLPKILTKSNSYGGYGAGAGGGAGGGGGSGGSGVGGIGATCTGKMALELTHGKSKQLISLPSDKLDSNKRYYVTFTVKESTSSNSATATAMTTAAPAAATADRTDKQQQDDSNELSKTASLNGQ